MSSGVAEGAPARRGAEQLCTAAAAAATAVNQPRSLAATMQIERFIPSESLSHLGREIHQDLLILRSCVFMRLSARLHNLFPFPPSQPLLPFHLFKLIELRPTRRPTQVNYPIRQPARY